MIPDSMQLKAQPCVGTLTRYLPWLQLICKVLCLYCYSPGVNNLAALLMLLLLLCLPAAANFYIVVSQDVVTVAQLLYLKCMHVLVETSIYVACYSHQGISTYVLLVFSRILLCGLAFAIQSV